MVLMLFVCNRLNVLNFVIDRRLSCLAVIVYCQLIVIVHFKSVGSQVLHMQQASARSGMGYITH